MWVEIFAFYLAHFDDFLTTRMALSRVGNAYEGNFFLRKIASSTWRLLLYKLSLATLVVSLYLYLGSPSLISYLILGDTIFEFSISAWNLYQGYVGTRPKR
ncbi:DUF5658 family protein [Sulfuracidifex tepidarius]|uniref:DUF5658 domain-containing protein n=1 Tax=Sulfuracidifex tepidarius TaxID=1294262 RepID=A0A510DT58_9CREN|nr:DUF5658 family protein [Sulfuracidifex tepidarius]BBG23359.1 hypothetical protein IC006_0643 [Sulfuracidifex tepidarius]BBG23362.1 hypothetical protein IC006_0646 [Sulfuracidifex tepidarius]BBG26113.1 hypothetical protein IC007_0618 [Sulfuracidifex tepidarius]